VKNNPYKILEISSNTTTESEIKRAFQRMALKYHPDRNKNSEESKRKFMDIVEAYEILSDNQARKNYDNRNDTYYGSSKYYNDMNLLISVLQKIVVQLSRTASQ
jgi:DnaJ-class molecular chaperone